jgi:hypothetical protein
MTKEDFEKLVEKDPNKDEILERAKTGLGVLNNDEEWYDICARQYELCNGNLGSFWQNLFKILDSHKYRKENLKIIEENDITVVVNGSIVGTDDYAVSIRKNTKPCQVLRVYDRDISTYTIKL